jgi:hypothetical protein|tara:strand:+ start:41206 stop:41586 length:381 start_codon:yes stop_codon:yes gene_type:complete
MTMVITSGLLLFSIWELGAQDNVSGQFRNLQVLDKDISKDKLKATMNSFTDHLDVKCTFCHILDEYYKDEKKNKLIGRKMIKLVRHLKEKTELFFPEEFKADEITCWTCHQGQAEIKPFAPDEDWP